MEFGEAATPTNQRVVRTKSDPIRVRGRCRRQVDGTVGLPRAPEMPCVPRQFTIGATFGHHDG